MFWLGLQGSLRLSESFRFCQNIKTGTIENGFKKHETLGFLVKDSAVLESGSFWKVDSSSTNNPLTWRLTQREFENRFCSNNFYFVSRDIFLIHKLGVSSKPGVSN